MNSCPYCGKEPTVEKIGLRAFLAQCECGAYAAYRTVTGIHPAVMRLRKTALGQWSQGFIFRDPDEHELCSR